MLHQLESKHLISGLVISLIGIVMYYYGVGYEMEQTLCIIKPSFVHNLEDIQNIILRDGFTIISTKELQLTKEQAMEFYYEHSHRSFFVDLVEYMISGPIIAMKIERLNAIKRWRLLIGPTNPEAAKRSHPNSIRALYGTSIQENVVHGSDSKQSAKTELLFFFPNSE